MMTVSEHRQKDADTKLRKNHYPVSSVGVTTARIENQHQQHPHQQGQHGHHQQDSACNGGLMDNAYK